MPIRINKNGRQNGRHEISSLLKLKFIFGWRGVEQNGAVRANYINNLYDFLQYTYKYSTVQCSTSTYFDRKRFASLHIRFVANP